MAKETRKSATGSCTLFDDSTPFLCGGNVKFRMRSEDETKCNAVPAAIVLRNVAWVLENLDAFEQVTSVPERFLTALESAALARNVLKFRPRHRS